MSQLDLFSNKRHRKAKDWILGSYSGTLCRGHLQPITILENQFPMVFQPPGRVFVLKGLSIAWEIRKLVCANRTNYILVQIQANAVVSSFEISGIDTFWSNKYSKKFHGLPPYTIL